jgi:hypothetical protein
MKFNVATKNMATIIATCGDCLIGIISNNVKYNILNKLLLNNFTNQDGKFGAAIDA